jgi:hypothetical protein
MNTTIFCALTLLASQAPAADEATPAPAEAPAEATDAEAPAEAPAPVEEPAPPAAPQPPPAPPVDVGPQEVSLAVYELQVGDMDPLIGRIVTDAVVAELRKLEGVTVTSMDEVNAMLDHEAQKQIMGCEDESCLAEIAAALGVDEIVIGSIARVGEGTVFGLKRIDQREAKTKGGVNKRLEAASGEETLAVVGPAIEELFPEYPLRPGQTRGVDPELAVRLNPPPLDTWVFWTGVGLSGGALLLSSVALAANGGAFAMATADTNASIDGDPIDGKALQGTISVIRASFWTAVVTAGLAVALGSATGVSALFTDWQGIRAMNELDEAATDAEAAPPKS